MLPEKVKKKIKYKPLTSPWFIELEEHGHHQCIQLFSQEHPQCKGLVSAFSRLLRGLVPTSRTALMLLSPKVWDQLATQTGRKEPFCTTAVVWKYPNVTRDGNLDLFLLSSISCSEQDSDMLYINDSLMSRLLTAGAGGLHVHSAHRDGPDKQH